MPMKPGKDETQSEFMSRCVPEMIGEGDDKRPKEQAVAICLDIWRNKSKDQGAIEPQRKTHVDSDHDGLEYILSDAGIDRMGDIIESTGWDFTDFQKNPIALFNHDPNQIVGRWRNLRVEDGALRGNLQLAVAGTSPRIDEIRALVEQGILRAVSVGFRAIRHEPRDPENPWKGLKFTQQELLETSLVSVPANANALQVAKSLKISDDTLAAVFGRSAAEKHGVVTRQNGGSAETSPTIKRAVMTTPANGPLAARIETAQTRLVALQDSLNAHLATVDDNNPTDEANAKTTEINGQIAKQQNLLESLKASELRLGMTSEPVSKGNGSGNGNGTTSAIAVSGPRPFAAPAKKVRPSDHLFRALTVSLKQVIEGHKRTVLDMLKDTYGENQDSEYTRVIMGQMITRAATIPADTVTTAWAAELVTHAIADFMESLLPVSIYPQLASRGARFTFGRNGVVTIPYRESTPTIAGAFVQQGAPIPVKQGAFNALTLTPKKMGVISAFTREIAEHSTPAIEGLIRQAITDDTAVAIDAVLLDANPATIVRPPGLRNGVASLTPTGGGGVLAAVIGDLKGMINALTSATAGNFRSPVWIVNPGDLLSIAMMPTATSGDMPFRDEVGRGTLMGIPIIQSTSTPADTMMLIDAADFAAATGDTPAFTVSDQATLHFEDTNPQPIVATGPTPAAPTRSLWQTDTIAVRMILDINWSMRRTGMVQYVSPLGWN
jgi:HK97 family phage prohead protease/HK97 family phage major capsid protein